MTTRGLRNNNPGNIDRNTIKWQGMADDQSSDPRFVVFKAPVFGIRALAKTLLAYQNQHGCKTIRQIINRWAPPSENKTEAYVQRGRRRLRRRARRSGGNVDQVGNHAPAGQGHHHPRERLAALSRTPPCSEGLNLAGIADARPKSLKAQNTFQAHVGAGVSIVMAGGIEVAKQAPDRQGLGGPALGLHRLSDHRARRDRAAHRRRRPDHPRHRRRSPETAEPHLMDILIGLALVAVVVMVVFLAKHHVKPGTDPKVIAVGIGSRAGDWSCRPARPRLRGGFQGPGPGVRRDPEPHRSAGRRHCAG
jgi:hypothetical protein